MVMQIMRLLERSAFRDGTGILTASRGAENEKKNRSNKADRAQRSDQVPQENQLSPEFDLTFVPGLLCVFLCSYSPDRKSLRSNPVVSFFFGVGVGEEAPGIVPRLVLEVLEALETAG